MILKKIVVVVVLVTLAGWLGWRFHRGSGIDPVMAGRLAGGGRSIPVETAAVGRADVTDSSRFSGTLQPRADFTVAPRVAGRLQNLLVDIGDTVTNGQLIAVIDDEEYAQHLDQVRAEREVAHANLAESISALEIAVRDRDRVQALHLQRVVSDTERDAAQARYDAAAARRRVSEAQLDQREAALAAARTRLSYARIHAVWEADGAERVIGERFVHEGALLSVGQPIVSIVDVDRLVAVVTVVERDYPRLAVGQTAQVVADAMPGEVFDGTVARIAPLISEQSRQARVEIDLPNRQRRLRPGMFVRAEIVFGIVEDACVVPVASLTQRNGMTGVFQVDDASGTARFLPVTVGIADRDVVQIVDARLSGRVVTLGRHLLSDGSPVSVVNSIVSDSGPESDASSR